MGLGKNDLENEIKKYSLIAPLSSILEFERLFKETKEKFVDSDNDFSEEEMIRLTSAVFYRRVLIYDSYIDRWDRGLFLPNEEELKCLKKYQENFDAKIIAEYNDIKQRNPSLASQIEEEKAVAIERKKTLDKLLEQDKPRQKAEDLLKKYKDNPPFSDDKSAENEFNEKITGLQNQIKDLENNQNQDSSLEKDHKYKRELERLKAELEDLKRRGQKTSPTSPGKKNDNFPYGLVIGGGVVIFLLLIAVIFFWQRSKRK